MRAHALLQHALRRAFKGVGTFLEDGQASVSAIRAGLESSYIGGAQNLQTSDNSEG